MIIKIEYRDYNDDGEEIGLATCEHDFDHLDLFVDSWSEWNQETKIKELSRLLKIEEITSIDEIGKLPEPENDWKPEYR